MPDRFDIDPATQKVVVDITKEEDARARREPPIEEPLGMLPTAQFRRRTFRRPEDTEASCVWERYWQFSYRSYRPWTSGGFRYNGTRFFNRVTTNFTAALESLGLNQGLTGFTNTTIEAFDPNALPMAGGTASLTFNKETGTGTLVNPFGSYPLNPPLVFISGLGQRWYEVYQFRNYWLTLMLMKQTGRTATLSYDVEPNWVTFNLPTNIFRVSRNGGSLALEGVNVIQDFGQVNEYIDGGYVLPDPAPCNEADLQAEDARQAFENQFDSYLHISNIVFGAMQGG